MKCTFGLFYVIREDVLQGKDVVSRDSVKENQRGRAYVRPSHQVVGCFAHGEDGWVFDDFVRDIQVVRVLNECPTRLTSAIFIAQ